MVLTTEPRAELREVSESCASMMRMPFFGLRATVGFAAGGAMLRSRVCFARLGRVPWPRGAVERSDFELLTPPCVL